MKKTGLTQCTGAEVREMFSLATSWLERNVSSIDLLNVFPVPDGDTGTNMFLTMKATMAEAGKVSSTSLPEVMEAIARGALLGARGNSGVILSQFFRGLSRGLNHREALDSFWWAQALKEASVTAYKGVSRPVEGTILTVIKDAALAAQEKAKEDGVGLLEVMETSVEAARASVARTPELLPVLRQAGVVDAGGHGFLILLEGALRYLYGEKTTASWKVAAPTPPVSPPPFQGEAQFGYCTEFILQGRNLDAEKMKSHIEALGESALVVGDEATLRVHLHTFDPGALLSYATALGTLSNIRIQNIDEQHREYLSRWGTASLAITTVAVALGEGLQEVFYSLGAGGVVSGGQTMNPSTQELLEAVEAAPAEKVIILPNNSNIIPVALQASPLAKKTVSVVPTTTIPQGIAALLAFTPEKTLEENCLEMERARREVVSLEVTRAIRAATIPPFTVKKGEAMAFRDGELVAVSSSCEEVVEEALAQAPPRPGSVVTLYWGQETPPEKAQALGERLRELFPRIEAEVVMGGQPHYAYLISLE